MWDGHHSQFENVPAPTGQLNYNGNELLNRIFKKIRVAVTTY
jgi:hypothetical protein